MLSVDALTMLQEEVNVLQHGAVETKHNAIVLQRTFDRYYDVELVLSRGKFEVNNDFVRR